MDLEMLDQLATCYERAVKECTSQQLKAFVLGQASRLQTGGELRPYVLASVRFLDNLLDKKRVRQGLRIVR